jgi:hypothetical protein
VLKNYIKLANGLIKQEYYEKIQYGYDYSQKRNYGIDGVKISYLRLGFIIGVIKKTPSDILDVGYGSGEFLSAAKVIVPNCYGFDISSYPVPDGVEKLNQISNFDGEVITMFDVLEHFGDIYVIKDFKCKYLIVSLPNCHYFSDEWFENWKHRRPNEHLWHFNEKSLINFMEEAGYKFISSCNLEDSVRLSQGPYPNILTAAFKKV